MRTALTIAGVTLSGTALGVLAYTAVSVPSASPVSGNAASSATAGNRQATTCEKPARVIGSSCVTVVHVRDRGAGAAVSSRPIGSTAAATPTALGTPSPPRLPSAFDDHGGDDEWDEDGSDHDDRGASGDRDDDGDEHAEDAREDSADEREDRVEHRDDVWEDLHDDD